jgi:hypothetical protein
MAGVAQNGSGTQNGRPNFNTIGCAGLYRMRPVAGHVQTAVGSLRSAAFVAVERLTQTIKSIWQNLQ